MTINESIEYAKLRSGYLCVKTFPVSKQYNDIDVSEIWRNLLNEDVFNELPKTDDTKLLLCLAKIVHLHNGKLLSLTFNSANGYSRKVNSMTCSFSFTFNELLLFEERWEEELKVLYNN